MAEWKLFGLISSLGVDKTLTDQDRRIGYQYLQGS